MGVVTDIRPEDIAAMRAEGTLRDYIRMTTGRPVVTTPEPDVEDAPPCYHIARPGAWPCGTAASGPTPGPTCPCCTKERT